MLNPFGSDQTIGDLFDLLRPSAQEQYLQAKMRRQMDVHGRNNCIHMVVLIFRELFFQLSLVVIVDQREGSDSLGILLLQFVFDEEISNHVTDGFRAVLITLGVRQGVEFI